VEIQSKDSEFAHDVCGLLSLPLARRGQWPPRLSPVTATYFAHALLKCPSPEWLDLEAFFS
jgi:hypothetical protein